MALEDTAKRLIDKFGRSATLVRRAAAPANVNAPWDAAEVETSTAVSIVFTGTSGDQQEPNNVESGGTGALVAGLDAAEITAGDRIIDGSVTWQVRSAAPVQPGATLYIWKLVLGR